MTVAPSLVRIGLLGCGNVGSSLVRLLAAQRDTIAARTGLRLEVTRIAVRDLGRDRGLDVSADVFTDDAGALVVDPDVDVIVEVIGGVAPPQALLLTALAAGKPVITANKELLAKHGADLFDAAAAAGVDVLFEAAVAGGIPLMRPLRESLAGDDITRVLGIVNGTTNYILTRMTESGADYATALGEAQALGFAEPDPTADVEGLDAAAKAAIIAMVAFGVRVSAGDVAAEGISGITDADIAFAARHGYVIKLLAVAERFDIAGGRSINVRVHPVLVPREHPLASVRESFNAVFVEGAAVGELMFYGRGAGGFPTASALLGDVVDAAVNLRKGSHATIGELSEATFRPATELSSEYCLRIDVADRPGVLAQVAGVFGAHGVSIRSMEQDGLGDEARLVFITHAAVGADLDATLAGLRKLDVVDRVGSVLRVLGS